MMSDGTWGKAYRTPGKATSAPIDRYLGIILLLDKGRYVISFSTAFYLSVLL